MNRDEIRKDILAFVDDESDVIIEPQGDILFYKNGQEQMCSIRTDSNVMKVHYNGEVLSYNDFVSKKLARLDIFSQKIIEKRKKLEEFIDGPARLYTNYTNEDGKALELLKKECDNFFEFGSKITFITADAGHGKSILLKQFQYEQAERYSRKESNYLFWHIDLQGRDLVRLAEAIMYDLGELRMPGLYYPSIINLVQKRMIILAIDGFDELAAEIGGTNAVSSLSNFINQMNGSGTLVCASRRTFFDTGDYLKKTNIINNGKNFDIFFNEIKLKDWKEEQVVEYFDALAYDDPGKMYQSILVELQNDVNHPILTRPFLLAKLEKALESDASQIPTFFSNRNDCDDGVAIIVESFMHREVGKWKDRNATDQETGKPYLTFDQHIQLLSSIAKEMWESKRDYITKEEIEFYTVMLVDEWGLADDIKRKVVRFSTSHAFLIPKDDLNNRRFDHEEFRYYFLARALAELIKRCIVSKDFSSLRRFLFIDQLPDSVATYCFNYVDNRSEITGDILEAFTEMVNKEWKPTYLQLNIGTLIPFLLHNLDNSRLRIKSKINYSSLVFESKTIKNITFEDGEFVNISVRNTSLENIEFINCHFNEIKIEESSSNTLKNVKLKDSEVNSIIVLQDGQIKEMAYAPGRIRYLLKRMGIMLENNDEQVVEKRNNGTTIFKKTLLKFVFKYNQQMIQYEKNIREEKYMGNDFPLIFDEVIPVLEKYNIIEKVDTKISRQNKSNAWRLLIDIEELLKCDREEDSCRYSAFWTEVNSHQ